MSDYIVRYFDTEHEQNWTSLNRGLQDRFSSDLDKPKSFELLVNCKQKKDEDVQFYGERNLQLAKKHIPTRMKT